jgi:hypothetical protein
MTVSALRLSTITATQACGQSLSPPRGYDGDNLIEETNASGGVVTRYTKTETRPANGSCRTAD